MISSIMPIHGFIVTNNSKISILPFDGKCHRKIAPKHEPIQKVMNEELYLKVRLKRSLLEAGDTRADIVGRQRGPTANNKEYSSLRHYCAIVHYRLLQ